MTVGGVVLAVRKVLLLAILWCAGAARADGLDLASPDAVLRRSGGALRRCYARALKDTPRLGGKLVLAIEIADTGAVRTVKVESSTLRAPSLEICVARAVERLRFAPGSAERITVPILFSPGA